MKPITRDFQNALKTIKQVDVIISYADRENTNFIVTQNSELLQTEAQDFLVTQSAEAIIDNGGIQNCGIYWNTDILKSCCKMLDLETSNAIPKGTELFVRIGILVDEDYEYIDYGSFFTTQESEKKLDTGTYLTTAYDKMVKFNINANENPLTFEEGTTYTLKQYLEMICSKCGVPYSLSDLSSNTNAVISLIDIDPYLTNKDVTYRDIIDDIAECLGINFIIDKDNKFTTKDFATTFTQEDSDRVTQILLNAITPTEEDYRKYDLNRDGKIDIIDDTTITRIRNGQTLPYVSVLAINDDNLKDSNVNVGEKKEAIDGIEVYDGTAILNYVGSDNSIFKIKNNNIMSAHSSQLLNYVFTKIEGISYYEYELDTFGVLALEPFDFYYLDNTGNNTRYMLMSLHNEINANQGLTENISYQFKDTDGTYEYATTSDEDKRRNAYIELDKANSQIVLKADSNGKIVEARLNADADEGSSFNIKADNINLEGYTTINGAFTIDNSGNMTCSGATFKDGEIKLVDTTNVSDILNIYKYWDDNDGVWKSQINLNGFDGSGVMIKPGWFEITGGDGINYIDLYDGTIECDELYVRGSKNRLVRISNYEGVLLNAYETATPYFGDIGSGKTNKEGYCKIMIDDLFAQTIENDDYKVFIQKCGDGDLYVEKHKNYFEVKGTPNLDFDWELKAIQKGYKDRRLERKEMKPLKGDDK